MAEHQIVDLGVAGSSPASHPLAATFEPLGDGRGPARMGVLMSRSCRSEPPRKRLRQILVREVSHPGHMTVGPNQHGAWRRDRAECRKLPRADVFGVDQLNPICPWSDVEAAGFTEVEEDWPGIVQQGEYARGTVRGLEVEVGHAPPEQRVSLSEVVLDVQARVHPCASPAW